MGEKNEILFISASPRNLAESRAEAELRAIEQAIRRASDRDRYPIVRCPAARREDLQEALLRHRPRIVHFSGHAEAEGLLLENEYEEEAPIRGAALAALFAETAVRIVFLNACHSHATAKSFSHLVDYTIAMRGAISDAAATAFASMFYGALANRRLPDEAFRWAIRELQLQQIPEWEVPELLVRPGLVPPAPDDPKEMPRRRKGEGDTWIFIGDGHHIERK